MAVSASGAALAARHRHESRREEYQTQRRVIELLTRHLDPARTFFTSVENMPRSAISAIHQRRRGVRSGLPDLMLLHDGGRAVFLELKSKRGVASAAQREVAAEIRAAGGRWWLCRSPRSAMAALCLSGVVFRRRWRLPQLQPWEGPTEDPWARLPQHPRVARERRQAQQRWRAREAARRTEQPAPIIPGPQPVANDAQA